jgi:hypothetical protein
VSEQLAVHEAAFAGAREDLAAIVETWQPRSIRVLDLNIGQGFGNGVRDERGTDPGDLDEIGQIIQDSGANVVTMQEVFRPDAAEVARWLEENAGGEWDVHFAGASDKMQWDDSFIPDGELHPFGNAVLVRRGGAIESSTEGAETTLESQGPLSPINVGAEGRSMQHVEVQLTD